MNTFTKSFLLTAAMALTSSAFAGLHSEGDGLPKGKAGDGHCIYMQQNNMMDSKVKTCELPANAEGCKTLGSTDDNSGAAHGKGNCPTADSKGSCVTEEITYVYYDGDWEGMETGCGFQDGEWTTF